MATLQSATVPGNVVSLDGSPVVLRPTDDPVVSLCVEWQGMNEALLKNKEEWLSLSGELGERRRAKVEAERDHLIVSLDNLSELIAITQAQTIAGVLAKLALVWDHEWQGAWRDQCCTANEFFLGALSDLRCFARRR